MKRHLSILAAALVLAILPTLSASASALAFAPQTTAATNALAWLHTQQSGDGTVAGNASRTEETTWGLVANNASVTDFATSGKTTIDSLRAHLADEEKTAGNTGSLIMAVSAAGLDPHNFGGRNLLQDLQCTYNASTGAYNTQLFNDALAILALPAGKATTKAKDFLASQQKADGGWEFGAGFGSDTNTTALVLMALVSADGLSTTVRDRAVAYFKTQQQASGGFEYSTGSGDSDPNSDATVIEALLAVGQNPTGPTWLLNDKNPVTDLLTFQFSNGGFGFNRPGSSPTAAPDAASTTQALPSLASRSLPVVRTTGDVPSTCPPTTTTPTPSPTPAPIPARVLAGTGSPPVAPVVGLLMIVLGLRVRQRAR